MANETSAFEIRPMDQFIITPLFSEGDLNWYTFTNQSLWMLIGLIGIILLLLSINSGFDPQKYLLVAGFKLDRFTTYGWFSCFFVV